MKVNLKQNNMATELVIRGYISGISGRKTTVEVTISAQDQVCVEGKVLAIRMTKENFTRNC